MFSDQLEIRTASSTWVIPHDCRLLKELLKACKLHAADLHFDDDLECRDFIQRLALLATQQELRGDDASCISELLHELMAARYAISDKHAHSVSAL